MHYCHGISVIVSTRLVNSVGVITRGIVQPMSWHSAAMSSAMRADSSQAGPTQVHNTDSVVLSGWSRLRWTQW